jgi:hypothetical protein
MSNSITQTQEGNGYDLTTMIFEHISARISRMKSSEKATCRALFDSWVWDAIPSSDRQHSIGPFVSMIVAQGKVPLEFAGFNSARHNLYRKM